MQRVWMNNEVTTLIERVSSSSAQELELRQCVLIVSIFCASVAKKMNNEK